MVYSWLSRVYKGWQATQLCGDYVINRFKHPRMKQPGFNGRYEDFFRAHETFGCGAVPNKGCMPSGRNWSALYLIYLVSATSSCFLTGCMSWMKGLALWLQGKSWLHATILPRQFSSKKGRKVAGAHPEELLLMPYRKLGSCAVRIKQGRQLIQVASPREENGSAEGWPNSHSKTLSSPRNQLSLMWKLPSAGILRHCCQSSLKQNLAMWRCISYIKQWFSIAMLVCRRVTVCTWKIGFPSN